MQTVVSNRYMWRASLVPERFQSGLIRRLGASALEARHGYLAIKVDTFHDGTSAKAEAMSEGKSAALRSCARV